MNKIHISETIFARNYQKASLAKMYVDDITCKIKEFCLQQYPDFGVIIDMPIRNGSGCTDGFVVRIESDVVPGHVIKKMVETLEYMVDDAESEYCYW
jgi:hypothetical protein